MSWQFTVFSIPILFAFAVSLVMVGYIVVGYRDRRDDPLVVLYFWITVAAIVWTGFSALKLLHTDPATKLLSYRLLHVGAAALPPLLFLFVVAFTNRSRWLRYDVVGGVFLVPAIFVGLLFGGPEGLVIAGTQVIENGLVILRVEDGPGFLLFATYSTLLAGATLGLVGVEIRRFGSGYYPQALLIGGAVLTPILFTVLTVAGIAPFGGERMNLVPTAASVSIIAFGVLLYRYRLVDLPPLAYATAMQHSPDVLFVLDREARVVSTNDHGRTLLDTLDGHIGDPLADSIPGFDPDAMANELLELPDPSGESTYRRVFVEPLTRGERRVGWVVVLRDETRQQRQHHRLAQQNEQLDLLASTISHDLRNPLNVAQGYLELAQAESEHESLEKIEAAHTRMAEIIDEVLTLARAGQQIDNPETVSLQAVVETAWENVTTATADLVVAADRTIMADPTMIQHVFENLFRNSIEHGGSDVTVTVGLLPDGFYVEDDGRGIPLDERDAVFDVGYSNTAEGTGFGLSIVNQVVTAHDWDIHATDGTDGGARFEITGITFADEQLP